MSFKGRKHTEQTRHRMSEGQKKRFAENPNSHPLLGTKTPKDVVEKQKEGHLKYYQSHHAWNLGLPWSIDVRERIREGCLNSIIGMGHKENKTIKQTISNIQENT